MKIFRLLGITLCFVLFPLLMSAQESSDQSKKEIIKKIVDSISFEEKLNQSPNDLHEQFSQNPFGLPPDQNEKMMELFLQAFTADTLVNNAQKTLHENFNREHAQAVTDWLEKQNTQTVLNTKNEFYNLQGIRKRVVNRYELEQNPPSDERTELINSLAKNMSAADAEIESQVILFRSIVSALGMISDQRSLSESQIDNFVQNFRSQIQSQINQEVTEQLMLQYHGLGNEVLRQYSAFYESEAGNWLSESTAEATLSAYQRASDRFLELVKNR